MRIKLCGITSLTSLFHRILHLSLKCFYLFVNVSGRCWHSSHRFRWTFLILSLSLFIDCWLLQAFLILKTVTCQTVVCCVPPVSLPGAFFVHKVYFAQIQSCTSDALWIGGFAFIDMLVIQICLLFIIVSISTPCLTCRNEWLTVMISKRILPYAALQAASTCTPAPGRG